MLKKYQNMIIITSFILILLFASVVYILEMWFLFLPFTLIGTILFWMMYTANNLYRIYPNKILKFYTENMYFFGMMAFVLLLAHEAKFSIAMERQTLDENYYPYLFFSISFYLFLLIIPMAITSVQKYRPTNWKIIQRIFMWSSLPLIIIHLWQVDYYISSLLFVLPLLISIYSIIFTNKNFKIYRLQLLSFIVTIIIFLLITQALTFTLTIILIILALILIYIRINKQYLKFHSIAVKLLIFIILSIILMITTFI